MSWMRLWIALIVVPAGLGAQSVADWLPIHTGDTWIYDHVARDENGEGRAHPSVHRWRTEEKIVGSWTLQEGLLVGRQVRAIDGVPPALVNPNPAYLMRGGCVYADDTVTGWEPRTHQLTAAFREALTAGYLSPDFCFPLTVHKRWGAPHGLPDWNAAQPEDARDWEVVGGDAGRAIHISSISGYPGAGITVEIWFAKGVGVVREEAIHHGTLGERRKRLVRFEPAAPR